MALTMQDLLKFDKRILAEGIWRLDGVHPFDRLRMGAHSTDKDEVSWRA